VRVKICGIATIEDARAAAAAGADAIGCLVGLDYEAPDRVEPETARRIFAALPPFVARVLVTHRTSVEEVVAIALAAAPTVVQLHGEFPLERIPLLRAALPHVAIVKNIHVAGEDALEAAVEAAAVADAVLLDTKTAGRIGGTGTPHDWGISARIVQAVPLPVILAGGLRPENVAEAVARVHPWAVDVNSGTKGPDGRKSHEKIRAFVAAAKEVSA
jgi:phosphoribosylanthranilate isomerase